MKQTKHSNQSHRYELVHAKMPILSPIKRKFGDDLWQTVST